MNEKSFNPSLMISSLLGEQVSNESELFLKFVEAYYEWMQSTRLEIVNASGTFTKGETIVGATSRVSATIKEVGTDYLVVILSSKHPFSKSEVVTGQSSSATGTIYSYKDNVVRRSGNLVNYRDLDLSVDNYVDFLKDELFSSVPIEYYGDKRLLATKFKDLFNSKSNEESYRFLFKLLYNEEIDFYYPGNDVLRVSDGNFEKTQIIRTYSSAAGVDDEGDPTVRSIFDFQNKIVRGRTSGVLANVVDIKKFYLGSVETAEMTLKLVSGTFAAGEVIESVDDTTLTTTLYGIISGFQIVDAGTGYQVGDLITISGDGAQAQAIVSSIQDSPISALSVNSVGYGYRVGTDAVINNSGTGGTGLVVRVTEITNPYQVTDGSNTYTVGEVSRVQILNRGTGYFKSPTITLIDTEIQALGLLSENLITIEDGGSNYGVGNTVVFTGGSGANAEGIVASVEETTTYDFLLEDGDRVLLDGGVEDILKNEDWDVLGAITRIELTNFGDGYTEEDLPTITVTSTTGSSANLIATGIQGSSASISVDAANNVTGIGSIRAIEITKFGINYTTATADASGVGDGNANVIPVITGLGITTGNWVDDDGKIDYKYIQDSYFYQDFSYSIKSGLAFSYYKDTLKQILHPAGLQAFGEILIKDFLDVSPIMSTEVETLRQVQELLLKIITSVTFASTDISGSYRLQIPTDVIHTESSLLNNRQMHVEINPNVNAESYLNRELKVVVETETIAELQDVVLRSDFIISPVVMNTYPISVTGSYSTWNAITGTISSSSGSVYGDFLLETVANTEISSLAARTFEETASLIIGDGTAFTVDFAPGDQFYANNQLFTVALVFDDVTLLPSEVPDYSFTNEIAYKITPS